MREKLSYERRAEALEHFLDALDAWDCEDSAERARAILDFQASGYDLSEYEVANKLAFRVIDGGRAALTSTSPSEPETLGSVTLAGGE